jgi:hypothetical protein
MQPTSLAVTPTAPRASARDAPAAPALTLAADTRSVRQLMEDPLVPEKEIRVTGTRERVDALFAGDEPPNPDYIRLLVDQFYHDFVDVSRAYARALFAFFIVWLLTYLLARGFVDEATIANLKVDRVQWLLILSPPALGGAAYSFMTTFGLMKAKASIMHRLHVRIEPRLSVSEIVYFLGPPTFWNTEAGFNMMRRDGKPGVMTLVYTALMYALPFVPLLALAHVLWLIAPLCHWHPAWVVLSLAVGFVIWLKGYQTMNLAKLLTPVP